MPWGDSMHYGHATGQGKGNSLTASTDQVRSRASILPSGVHWKRSAAFREALGAGRSAERKKRVLRSPTYWLGSDTEAGSPSAGAMVDTVAMNA